LDEPNVIPYVILFAVVFYLYMLPAFLGRKRGVNNLGTLTMFNLLLGWTVLGWIVALLWAVSGQTKAADLFYRKAV
jgi:hypothetical protein